MNRESVLIDGREQANQDIIIAASPVHDVSLPERVHPLEMGFAAQIQVNISIMCFSCRVRNWCPNSRRYPQPVSRPEESWMVQEADLIVLPILNQCSHLLGIMFGLLQMYLLRL